MASNENITTRRPCEFIYFGRIFVCFQFHWKIHAHTRTPAAHTPDADYVQNTKSLQRVFVCGENAIAAYFHILFSSSSSSSSLSSSSMKCVLKARHAINYHCWSRESLWKSDPTFWVFRQFIPKIHVYWSQLCQLSDRLKYFQWGVRKKLLWRLWANATFQNMESY